MQVLIVDGANVVGSRPDGWWRDRAGAAARLHESLRCADLGADVVVLVLEGAARAGVSETAAGEGGPVRVVAAAGSGDEEIVRQVRGYVAGEGGPVRVAAAAGSGDDEIVRQVRGYVAGEGGPVRAEGTPEVTVVTADRGLRERVLAAGAAAVVGPWWLHERLASDGGRR